jgi:hypothetical protein
MNCNFGTVQPPSKSSEDGIKDYKTSPPELTTGAEPLAKKYCLSSDTDITWKKGTEQVEEKPGDVWARFV